MQDTPDRRQEAQQTRPGLKQVARFINVRGHAEHPNAAPGERQNAEREMADLERKFPGIRLTADRVLAALEAHGRQSNRGADPAAPPIDLGTFFDGLSDPAQPWYLRAWRAVRGGVELAPHLATAYRDTMAALVPADGRPLAPGKYEIVVDHNARGEVVVELRAHARDLGVEARLVRLMGAAQERVTQYLTTLT